ncbi:mechanosensitive ion channel family protein [Deinococcus peraridilitoris]|uniref:Small-conductance mechanosensitive channel n=1 Tax=Deinococcus peraridilitoris (strain DSM 19664 / LMG 22246 / CIP 109416 / KR-200) TaxID=937777 RepID=L0A3V8_DEIPD|nr:mechanosensitive ion channel family protein [Deinococcus peraridilitoris]AFZ67695.1 small-conductance mechanosensitive channel [Deinococcus peraridilitoris DSM 19664]
MSTGVNAAVERIQNIGRDLMAALPNVAIGLVVVLIFWFAARVVRTLIQRIWATRGYERDLALLFGRLASAALTVLGVLVALTIIFPSVTPASLFSLLGVGGVAIGFAFRDILQNLLAGILILLTRPFRIGDQIIVSGSEGTVEDIQVRATLIRTYDNRQVVIPNADLFTNTVTVNTAYDKRRLQYDVGIGYGDDIDMAKQVILETLQGVTSIRTDPVPEVLVVDLAESSVNLRVRWWIDPPLRKDALDTQDEVLHKLKEALLAHGIDLPFPTRQVLLHDQTETTDGDRARQREGWPRGQGDVPGARWIPRRSDKERVDKEQP